MESLGGLEIGREKRLNAFLSFLVRAERSNIIIRVINHQNQRDPGSGLAFFSSAGIKKGWNGTKQLVSTRTRQMRLMKIKTNFFLKKTG